MEVQEQAVEVCANLQNAIFKVAQASEGFSRFAEEQGLTYDSYDDQVTLLAAVIFAKLAEDDFYVLVDIATLMAKQWASISGEVAA